MKRIIIITGASSGIGQEFARQILDFRHADELWLVARRKERLLELKTELEATLEQKASIKGTNSLVIKVIPEDISGRRGYQLFSQLFTEEAQRGSFVIDTLVNNAGFGTYGPFEETPVERELEMVELKSARIGFSRVWVHCDA